MKKNYVKICNRRQLEDAGAPALVMYSLFEEEILHEDAELDHYLSHGSESFSESLSYFPDQIPHSRYQLNCGQTSDQNFQLGVKLTHHVNLMVLLVIGISLNKQLMQEIQQLELM